MRLAYRWEETVRPKQGLIKRSHPIQITQGNYVIVRVSAYLSSIILVAISRYNRSNDFTIRAHSNIDAKNFSRRIWKRQREPQFSERTCHIGSVAKLRDYVSGWFSGSNRSRHRQSRYLRLARVQRSASWNTGAAFQLKINLRHDSSNARIRVQRNFPVMHLRVERVSGRLACARSTTTWPFA